MTTRRIFRFRDFSGGLNLRDAGPELAENDLAQAWNVTIDDRGGVRGRDGYIPYASVYGAALVNNCFYWNNASTPHILVQAGTNLFKDNNSTPIKTFSTSARVGFADFGSKVYIAHPVDGLFSWDGTTFSGAIAGAPLADSLAVWQNKLWANDKAGTNPARIHWSAAGDPTTWSVSDFVDLREVNGDQVVCLSSGQGSLGAPLMSLLAFKENATHRINDSLTGSYTTVDPLIGAAGPMAVTSLLGLTYIVTRRGVFAIDSGDRLVPIGQKINALWQDVDVGRASQFAIGSSLDRLYISLTRTGSTVNDIALECNPAQGWFTAGSNAHTCYLTYLSGTAALLMGGSTTANGVMYKYLGPQPTDNGTSINSFIQTGWMEPKFGERARLNRVRVNGRGSFTLSPLYDNDLTATITRAISLPAGSATVHGGYQDVYNLGQAKAFSFRAEATTSVTTEIPFPLSPTTWHSGGGWGLYGIELYAVPLGRT